MIWFAYVLFMLALALALAERLKQVREAQERLAQHKKRALGL